MGSSGSKETGTRTASEGCEQNSSDSNSQSIEDPVFQRFLDSLSRHTPRHAVRQEFRRQLLLEKEALQEKYQKGLEEARQNAYNEYRQALERHLAGGSAAPAAGSSSNIGGSNNNASDSTKDTEGPPAAGNVGNELPTEDEEVGRESPCCPPGMVEPEAEAKLGKGSKHAAPSEENLSDEAITAEICHMDIEVTKLVSAKRRKLELDTLPYDSLSLQALQHTLHEAKALQELVLGCLQKLSVTLRPVSMGGEEYPVPAYPGRDLVRDVVTRLISVHGLPKKAFRMVTEGPVIMSPSDEIIKYDLVAPINLVFLNDPIDEQRLRLPFDSEDVGDRTDSHSGTLAGDWQSFADNISNFKIDGRSGVAVSGHGVLKLDSPIQIDGHVTVSVWTHFPTCNERNGYRVLLDGPTPESRILLCLCNKKLGYYWRHRAAGSAHKFIPRETFDLGAVSDGWHQLGVVGDETSLTYYVDGVRVGSQTCEAEFLQGSIDFIGNTAQGINQEGFSVISDFRIFATSATPDQMMELAQSE